MKNSRVELREIPIEQLVRGRFQPRQQFDLDKLAELAEAIKTTHGLLQPIVVRPIDPDKYEIIAGERRWRAAMLANLETVSCLIRNCNDQEALEAAIIENVSRTDLNPIEEAHAYQRLMAEFGYIHEEVALAVGKSRAKITNSLRMLKLDPRIQQFLIDGSLSEGHGKILAGLPYHSQFELANHTLKNAWSVRRVEQEVKKGLNDPARAQQINDPNIKTLEKSLSEYLGAKVKIDYANLQGKLEIDFQNLDILEGLFDKIGFNR
jgi:ParB family chromosome partitioning protein